MKQLRFQGNKINCFPEGPKILSDLLRLRMVLKFTKDNFSETIGVCF